MRATIDLLTKQRLIISESVAVQQQFFRADFTITRG